MAGIKSLFSSIRSILMSLTTFANHGHACCTADHACNRRYMLIAKIDASLLPAKTVLRQNAANLIVSIIWAVSRMMSVQRLGIEVKANGIHPSALANRFGRPSAVMPKARYNRKFGRKSKLSLHGRIAFVRHLRRLSRRKPRNSTQNGMGRNPF